MTDANSQATNFAYDSTWRISQASYPDAGQTKFTHQETTAPFTATLTKKITSLQSLATTNIFDGLGRVKQTQLTSDPEGAAITDTTYDALGRVATASNPYRATTEPTYGITTTQYDPLGRATKVIPPDGTATANNVTTTYSGNCATVTDQAGKIRKSCTDALGRLIQVFEPNSSGSLVNETDYQYDILDNLIRVDQKGNSADSTQWRTRTFTYNSLSQLLTASNPESGTITYTYDADGNLLTKTAPAPNQTGAATVTTTYSYDALHRITQKSSSDGTTPTVKYGYDGVAPIGCTPPALTVTNGIGRRTSMCDAAGAEAWSYDAMGRPLTDRRTTNAVTKDTTYTYNLDGSVATLTYPSGRTLTYTYNAAARATSAVDTANSINYAVSASYAPQGALASLLLGQSATFGGINLNQAYNSRLQPTSIRAWSTSATTPVALDLSYGFNLGAANDGNVTAITNNRDTTRSQSFAYDALNRLATAQTSATTGTKCWGEAFSYDPWGNLLSIGGLTGYTGCTQENLSVAATTKNQLSGDTYDAAGNLTNIPAVASYTYNAESQLVSTAGVTYTYDGDGKRVQKSNGKLYWYGMGSDPLDETDATGSTTNAAFSEYIFFNGKRIARRDSTNNVVYHFADHLGTARIVANAAGAVLDDSDFYPFGGERVITDTDPNRYKFTGKERDTESGLDNFTARYFGSSMGRFMSPDPLAGHTEDPQTLNRYVYVRNNPLNLTDPTGLDFNLQCAKQSDTCQKDSNGRLVQGTTTTTTDANGNTTSTFTATVVTSASLQDPNSGNTATVNQNGVQITTASGTSEGIFISGTAAANNVQGSGALQGFSFDINGNCSGSCLASGSFQYNGSLNAARALLDDRGSFRVLGPLEDIRAGFGFGAHPFSTQHRFGGADCSLFSCPNSPHLSVPYDPNGTLEPRNNVPATGGFHVDEHGDPFHHAQDVANKNPQ